MLSGNLNPLNAELNLICHLLALLGAHHIFHVSGLRVKFLEPSGPLQTCNGAAFKNEDKRTVHLGYIVTGMLLHPRSWNGWIATYNEGPGNRIPCVCRFRILITKICRLLHTDLTSLIRAPICLSDRGIWRSRSNRRLLLAAILSQFQPRPFFTN